jgi:hypothetical protein
MLQWFTPMASLSPCCEARVVLGGGMVILKSTRNTQLNTSQAGRGRGECIGTCLSLKSAPMTGGRTAQARSFSSGRHRQAHKRQDLAHTQQRKEITCGAGELPATCHLKPLPLRHRTLVCPGACDTGRFELQQLAVASSPACSAFAPTVRACEQDLARRRRRGCGVVD